MFEVGKKYIAPSNRFTYTCVGFSLDAKPIMQLSASAPIFCPVSPESWKEYKEPITTVAWVNVWENAEGKRHIGVPYSTEEGAKSLTDTSRSKRIAVLKVEHIG